MRRISSRMTRFQKRVFPVAWFGFLAVFLLVNLVAGQNAPLGARLPFILAPVVMALAGYFIMRSMIFSLADEVFDAGDALIVRKGGREDRVPFAAIKNVGYSQFANPKRITLSLRQPSLFGDQIVFLPPQRFAFPWSSNPIVDELIDRVDASRRR